jgi:hypothetical protein
MTRHLNIAPELLPTLGAPMLAQLEAVVDDPDNVCCGCGELIAGPIAEAILFTDGRLSLVRLADPGCVASGVYAHPEIRRDFDSLTQGGFDMLTRLTAREAAPRALLYLEPITLGAGLGEDPLELYAESLGLAPISGRIEDIEAPPTDAFVVAPVETGLELRLSGNTDWVEASPVLRREWTALADGRALVILARGLGLARTEPTIEEALMIRPAWGAVATVSG